MKLSLLLLATLAVSITAQVQTNTIPSDCRLSYVALGNGLQLSAPFDRDHLQYFCSCLYSTDWTTITAYPVDPAASITLSFNNGPATALYAFTESQRYNLQVGANIFKLHVTCGCEKEYTIECDRQPPSGGDVQGDPQFTGLRGQSYQIHGIAGQYYNIISDENMQMNAKFVFLNKGKCPVIDGVKQQACWTHPGQYLGEVGIMTKEGDKLKLISGPADQGFATVALNDQRLAVGDVVTLANGGQLNFNHTHLVQVTGVSTFDINFENSDMFINQKLAVNDWSKTHSHGLLGQTWRKTTYPNNVKYVEGTIEDYHVNGLFGNNFVYNQFKTQSN